MKKKIPIALRKILDNEFTNNENLFNTEFPENSIVKFIDVDPESDFYFEVISASDDKGRGLYEIKYQPYNELTIKERHATVPLDIFTTIFKNWKTLLNEANKESPLFDDVFTQTYFEDLGPKFEILDKDANYKPYSISQQKLISNFLENSKKIIIENDNSNSDEKNSTVDLIDITRDNLSKLTKKQVIHNLRKILAKGFKMGIDVGERLLIEFTTELVKKLILN